MTALNWALKNAAAQSLAFPALALLAVGVLLLPSLGPLLDHHFAERHPAHGHIYLGAVGLEHSHPFERPHSHHDGMYAPAAGEGNVVFFAPYDGAGHSHDGLAAAPVMPLLRFGDDAPPLLRNAGDDGAALRGITVAPLRQPPRA